MIVLADIAIQEKYKEHEMRVKDWIIHCHFIVRYTVYATIPERIFTEREASGLAQSVCE